MNFKDFLTQSLCEDQDTEAFKRNAYKRVFPDGRETDTDKMWASVLSKANYKLTKNSKKETRQAVGIAKGARTRAQSLGVETDEQTPPETDRLENWDDKDVAELKQTTDNKLIADCNTVDDLRNALENASDEDREELLDAIAGAEQDVDEIAWDENTLPAGVEPIEPATNTDNLSKIQEKQRQDRLAKKIQDNGIPVNSDGTPDFDNEDTLKKINDLMINGDDDLFNEYVLTQGVEKSDLVKEIQTRTAKENAIKKTELENREIRYQSEKDAKSALAGTAVVLDTLLTFFTGSEQKGFETLVEKRTQAKAIEHALKDQFESELGDKLKQQETNHAAELDNIEAHAKFRLEQAEALKTDPLQTETYKHKYLQLTKDYNAKKKQLEEQAPEVQRKMELRNKLEAALFQYSNTGEIDDLDTIKTLVPQVQGESDESYLQRIQSPEVIKQLEDVKDSVTSDIGHFNEDRQDLEKQLEADIKALKDDPDVQNDLKNTNAKYEFVKADILAETDRLKAKENKRYEDFKRVSKQIEDDIPRFCKNMSTLSVWASDPETVQCSEIAQRNAKMKSMYAMIGQEWDETENPTTLEGMKEAMSNRKGGRRFSDFDDFESWESPQSRGGSPRLGASKTPKALDNKPLKLNPNKKTEEPVGGVSDDKPSQSKKTEEPDGKPLKLNSNKKTEKPDKGSEGGSPEGSEKGVSDDKPSQSKKTEKPKEPKEDTGDQKASNGKISIRYSDNALKGVKVSDTSVKVTKDNFKKYKGSPEVLKAFTNGQTDSTDGIKDTEDTDATKLSGLSLKTLQEKLNKAGISVRALPGYSPDMSEDERKQLIIDYMKKHKAFFAGVLQGVNESLLRKKQFKCFSALLKHDFDVYS